MRVWVDCTAAAHPLVLRPIIERLRERGHEVEITAREYGQTVGILERLGLEHTVVGEHGGGSTLAQGRRARRRGARRSRAGRGRAASSSRSRTARSTWPWSRTLLRIPSVQMQDYEHAGLQRQLAFRAARRVLVPDAIPRRGDAEGRGAAPGKLVRYPGLKEDYYLAGLRARPRRAGRAGPRPRAGCWSWCARRRRPRRTTRTTRCTTGCSTGSPPTARRPRS